MGNKGSIIQESLPFHREKIAHNGEFVKFGACYMKGWREYMEDACIYVTNFPHHNHYLFGVFDGHGGPEIAQFVQRHFAASLLNNQNFQKNEYSLSLVQTFSKMDELIRSEQGRKEITEIIEHNIKICNRVQQIAEEEIGGCTANVCFVTDSDIYVANAGDSRCVACRRGRAVPLSFDHKPQDLAEFKRIKKAGGSVRNGRVNRALNMSRSLGDFEFKKNERLKPCEQMIISTPDVISCRREGVDFIIMGCDGIWQKKSSESMIEWIRVRLQKRREPVDILQQLFGEQLKQQEQGFITTDNMSAILIVFKN